jgi:ubiquinone/menaquinone biosynthesis C-methylase UbiE
MMTLKVSRRLALAVQFVLDELIPPIIRDSRWFMYFPMKLILKDATHDFITFKDTVFAMDTEAFGNLYKRTSHVGALQGETDLNEACVKEILESVGSGQTVLEVGCGRGFLAGLLSARGLKVTGCDIVLSEDVILKYPGVTFFEGNVQLLPLDDDSFDVVISTHTLEHVQDLSGAIAELRRVARRRLIVVVPRQRPYKYAFNLHTQFFPYRWSIEGAFGHRPGVTIRNLGDWFYLEDMVAGTGG